MKEYKLRLQAGESHNVAAMGDYVRVITSGGDFSITPDTGQALQGLKQGLGVTLPRQFNNLFIESQTTQEVILMIGLGRVDDNRVTIAGATDSTSKGLMIESNSYTVTTAPSEVLALNEARRSLILINKDDVNSVFVGGQGVTMTNGLKVGAGQSLVLDNSAPAALYAVAGTIVNIVILEEL